MLRPVPLRTPLLCPVPALITMQNATFCPLHWGATLIRQPYRHKRRLNNRCFQNSGLQSHAFLAQLCRIRVAGACVPFSMSKRIWLAVGTWRLSGNRPKREPLSAVHRDGDFRTRTAWPCRCLTRFLTYHTCCSWVAGGSALQRIGHGVNGRRDLLACIAAIGSAGESMLRVKHPRARGRP